VKERINHDATVRRLNVCCPLATSRERRGGCNDGRQSQAHISRSCDGDRGLCCERRRDLHEHRNSPDFVRRWLSAFLVGWPVAAVTAYVAFPLVRSATLLIVALIEGGGSV
jgi:hypothetical protein